MLTRALLLLALFQAIGLPANAQRMGGRCCRVDAFTAGLRIADRYRVAAIADRRFTHAEFWRAVEPALRSAAFRTETIGSSILGRPIRSVTFGAGSTRVLLWSQMHGDESTATMALADIFRYLAEAPDDALRERLRRSLTLVFIPMLNPDGAEVFQRENAVGIDVNRDARRQVTPEAQALKNTQERFRPQFGFNLHDQNARTRVGRRGVQSAIALLAPAYDSALSYNDVRSKARLVAATLATLFAHEIPGRVAKYDDTFNPRAFGDLMQQWGTSTVLIESGALPDDPQKQRLRALNVAAILGVLDAIATGTYDEAAVSAYESLPFNQGGAFDVLVMGGQLVLPGKPPILMDLAINYDDAVARQRGRVRDAGDLSEAVAIDTVNAAGLFLHPLPAALSTSPDGAMLRLGNVADFELRRG
ncbi:MAG TPA: M14 family zinc carboxypeptidase, partial [Gemmatimonadaceae bacterium]